jgi:hypothetical protein
MSASVTDVASSCRRLAEGGTKTYLSDTIHPPVKTGGLVEIILPKTQIGHRRYFAEHHNFTGDRFRCYVIYLAKKGCQGLRWLWGGRRRRQAMLIGLEAEYVNTTAPPFAFHRWHYRRNRR